LILAPINNELMLLNLDEVRNSMWETVVFGKINYVLNRMFLHIWMILNLDSPARIVSEFCAISFIFVAI